MSIRHLPHLRRPLAVAAVLGVTALTAGSAGIVPAFADGTGTTTGHVAVTNTETVQIYTDANGKVDSQRVYEQLTLSGHGSVDLANPVSTNGLRNLDGFGGVDVKNGDQIVDTTVDGEKALRTVSNYTGTSPLSIAVHYTLNGKPVDASGIVGKSGHLKVTYTVTNTSGVPTTLTYGDGNGGKVTKTVDVPIPMVASLALTTPDTYRNVTSTDANMGGDGHGGMMLSFTMTLLPPVGPTTSSVSYEADITDGVVPRAELTALPVDPLTSPTFASAASQYKGGADQGDQLTTGALKLDAGLLKLHSGAGQLLAGLIKLHNGAGQLRAGLQGQAAPGAQRLADGTGQLVGGMDKLNAGGQQLQGGMQQLDTGLNSLGANAPKLHAGTAAALAGGQQLAGGLKQLVNGLQQLAGTPQAPGLTAAPSAVQSAILFLSTVQKALGSATPTDQCTSATAPCTVLGGLASLQATLNDATAAKSGGTGDLSAYVAAAHSALQAALKPGGTLDELDAALATLNTDCAGDAKCLADLPTLTGLANALRTGLAAGDGTFQAASAEVTQAQQLVGDLDSLSTIASGTAARTALMQGTLAGVVSSLTGFETQVEKAVVGLVGDPAHPNQPALLPGAQAAATGASELAGGLGQLNAGTGQLLTGAAQLSAGGGKLLSGTGQLANGLGQADSGAHQLDSGAHQLATGLGTAASGSAQLDQGLGQAAAGAPKIRDGLTQASQQGSKKIAQAGEQTAQQFGEMYAELDAEAQRAHHHAMAYGAPAGATGLTAYDWIIQGADGHGARELDRSLALGGVLVVGAGGLLLRRRLLG